MKKKLLLILLIVFGTFSLVGCGNKNNEKEEKISKEDIIKQAREVDLGVLYSNYSTNKAKAEKNYVGNYYKISGYINAIESDYVTLSSSSKGATYMKVYLSKDELAELDRKYMIVVVGEIKGYEDNLVIMKDAYYVTNEFEIEGLIDYCGTIDKGFYCKTQAPVYYIHVTQEQAIAYDEKGKTIKVKGNIPKDIQYGYPSGINVVNVQIIE